MILDFFVRLQYQSSIIILAVFIKHPVRVRDLPFDGNNYVRSAK